MQIHFYGASLQTALKWFHGGLLTNSPSVTALVFSVVALFNFSYQDPDNENGFNGDAGIA